MDTLVFPSLRKLDEYARLSIHCTASCCS